jgi:hypothetical protein
VTFLWQLFTETCIVFHCEIQMPMCYIVRRIIYVVHKCPDHHSCVFMKGMEQTAHKAYLEFCHFYSRIRNMKLKVMVSIFCHRKQSKPHFFNLLCSVAGILYLYIILLYSVLGVILLYL